MSPEVPGHVSPALAFVSVCEPLATTTTTTTASMTVYFWLSAAGKLTPRGALVQHRRVYARPLEP